ncbi:MAG: anaerobic ribonucleoside-triphosphate reductase activating protein [Paludibacteraceae bacterium]|nr:anaerobic ribonucleoside-triphosphate reductase activating protein [Paludibacteraceae bacterium]
MRVASFDIVFQEIPGEVTLALNLSGCPCHCHGCHSPHLWEDIGEPLNEELLDGLLARYGSEITCVAFMGGDQDPDYVAQMAKYVRKRQTMTDYRQPMLRTAWYSGRMNFPITPLVSNQPISQPPFDYVKLGPYIEALGGLKSPTTNQRLYKWEDNTWTDITSSFWKSSF